MNLFSTEQVSKWHPDKYADQISDTLLTEYLKQDKYSHCGIEAMVKNDKVVIAGEIKSNAKIDRSEVVHAVAEKLGYDCSTVIDIISEQSPEIDEAVTRLETIGAGDQGMMYGYATVETSSRLPFGFDFANKIIDCLAQQVGKSCLLGDAKTQVTVDLEKKGMDSLHTIVISACHRGTLADCQEAVREAIEPLQIPQSARVVINPSGAWRIGGPTADCGLTGRKIVCDQYGGYCPVGGGAFSGKDPTKVDRSGAYMARHIAKELLEESEYLTWVEVQLAYAIGVSQPVSINVKSNEERMNEFLSKYLKRTYDLTPNGMINFLHLYDVDYGTLAEGCHYR